MENEIYSVNNASLMELFKHEYRKSFKDVNILKITLKEVHRYINHHIKNKNKSYFILVIGLVLLF